jgi:hypothetical protein
MRTAARTAAVMSYGVGESATVSESAATTAAAEQSADPEQGESARRGHTVQEEVAVHTAGRTGRQLEGDVDEQEVIHGIAKRPGDTVSKRRLIDVQDRRVVAPQSPAQHDARRAYRRSEISPGNP